MNQKIDKNKKPTQAHDDNTKQPKGISEPQILMWAESILEERFRRSNCITSPTHTRDYLHVTLTDKEREVFGIIFLDSQHGIIDFEILFHGTIDSASVYPREVVKAALKHNAAAVILAHNHPSGSPEPSNADKRITNHIVTALKTVDIRVLDHLIIGGAQSISFAERGLL